MKCIGIRCSNNDFCYAILSGNKVSPKLEASAIIAFPIGYSRTQSLKWFLQELEEISKKFTISAWAIKGAEAMATRGKEFTARIENEAMIFLHLANLGIDKIPRKVKATIAKDLGLPGKAKSLQTDLDHSVIPEYKSASEKSKEAILVAWSILK